jgi:hypothetical protein
MIGRYEETFAGRARAFGLALAAIALATLALAATVQAAGEYEPNDTRETASGPVAGGTWYTAGLETENDEDWYLLYIKTYSQMDFSATEVSGCTIVLTLYDKDGKYLNSFRSGEVNVTKHLLLTMNPGRYYLEANYGCTGNRYKFRVDPAAAVTTSRECGEAIVAKDAVGAQLNTVNQELAENAERLAKKSEAVHEAKADLHHASKKVRRLRNRHRPRWQIRQARRSVQQAVRELTETKEARAPVWQERVDLEALAGQHQQAIGAADSQIAAHC